MKTKKLKSNKKQSANVVDGKLILSFPHAVTPTLWQMDLKEAKMSSLSVSKKEDVHTLVMTPESGKNVDIATFKSNDEAIDALMAASSALENAHGQLHVAAASDSRNGKTTATQIHYHNKPKAKLWPYFVAILLLLIAFVAWANISPTSISGVPIRQNTAGVNTPNAADQSGVPVSADDFLSNR